MEKVDVLLNLNSRITEQEQHSQKNIKRFNKKFYKFNNDILLNINCIQSIKKTQINWTKLALEFDIEEDCIEFTMSNGKYYYVCDEEKNNYKRALEKFFLK